MAEIQGRGIRLIRRNLFSRGYSKYVKQSDSGFHIMRRGDVLAVIFTKEVAYLAD